MELKDFLTWDWPLFVALTAVGIVVCGIRYKIHLGYWKRRGFPEIPSRPLPFFGHIAGLILGKISFTDMFHHIYELAGDKPLVGYFHGILPVVMLKDPEIIKHILVKDSHIFDDRGLGFDEDIDPLNGKGLFNLKGQKWKEMRARLSPAFTSGRMKAIFPIMLACAEELGNSLSKHIEKSGVEALAEAKEFMACFSTDVIATCAFGIQCDALQNPETSKFRRMGKLVFEFTLRKKICMLISLISPRLLKWMGIKFMDDEASTFFFNLIKDLVKQKKKVIEQFENNSGMSRMSGDFIHHLIMLKKRGVHFKDENDEEEVDEDTNHGHNELKEESSWASLENEDLSAQVMLFFSAGLEPTSSLMTFVLYELSAQEKGRVIQERLREEIARVLEEDDGKLTYGGLLRMHLLDRVIKETLRLYPAAAFLSRKVNRSYKIPGTELVIDEGTPVIISVHSMQRDEKFFPNPKVFDPDRFLPGNKENIQKFSYLPFGDGPRLCIGERFALMQTRLGLASLIFKFKFELCREKTDIPLRFKKDAFVPTSETGIWLKVKHRGGKK